MRIIILFALYVTFGAAGCGKKEESKKAEAKADPNKGIVFVDEKGKQPPEPVAPNPGDGTAQVKPPPPPKSLAQNVRAAAFRPMRLNELRQIALFFKSYEIENNKPPRSKDEFINYIKRDASGIADAVKEDYYVLNLKVNMRESGGVVAYEAPLDGGGHQTARVDASVGIVTPDELKKLLGQ